MITDSSGNLGATTSAARLYRWVTPSPAAASHRPDLPRPPYRPAPHQQRRRDSSSRHHRHRAKRPGRGTVQEARSEAKRGGTPERGRDKTVDGASEASRSDPGKKDSPTNDC